jgi:hypothetical protein
VNKTDFSSIIVDMAHIGIADRPTRPSRNFSVGKKVIRGGVGQTHTGERRGGKLVVKQKRFKIRGNTPQNSNKKWTHTYVEGWA